MKELHELKTNLTEELRKYAKKDLSAGSLDVVDKLSRSIKNLEKIIENESGGYSGRMMRNPDGVVFGSSNARNRMHSNEGYSYDDMISKLYDMMEEATDDKKRQEFKRFIQRMENM